jgi:hypothetical protein
LLAAVAVAIAAAFMVGLTAKAVVARSSCSNQPTVVNLAASEDIAPAIETIANSYNKQNNSADGHCVEVQVNAGSSAVQASQIDGQTSLQGKPSFDAWIPDSSMWMDVARSRPVGAQVVQPSGQDVAKSPLMLVTTQAVAAKTQIFTSQPSWSLLLPASYGGPPANLGIGVDLPDPTGTSAGLAALVEVTRVLDQDYGDGPGSRASFSRFAFSSETLGDFDAPQALQGFVASVGPPFNHAAVTVASEQAVLAYDKANPKAPLAARYPTGVSSAYGSQELNFPFVVTTTNQAKVQAATAFGQYLQTGYAQTTIRYYGFRSADNAVAVMPASAGLSGLQLQVASPPTTAETDANLQAWDKLGLGSRDLVMFDISPAMNQPDGLGTGSLEEELSQSATGGLALFPPSTQMGLWVMGKTNGVSQPYTQLVSVGPLTEDLGLISRRQQMQEVDATLKTSDGTQALNDSILAAYKYMTKTYAARYANAVVVLTSGVDSAAGDMSTTALVKQLKALYNPNKKVELILLMFGSQGNFASLEQIAGATGGLAVPITDPVQIAKVFFAAVSQRLCDQGCAAP